MSHKTKKDEKKRAMRGPTFVGLAPRIEEGKRGRKEKQYQKHKNRRYTEDV